MKLAFLSLIFLFSSSSTFAVVVDLDLEKTLGLGNTAHAIIELAPITEDLFSAVTANDSLSNDQRSELVWNIVDQFTSTSQAPVIQLLNNLGLPYTSFLSANVILVPNLTPIGLSLLKDSGLNFNIREQETISIQPNGTIKKDSISILGDESPKVGASSLCLIKSPSSCPPSSSATNPTWNILATGAPTVWNSGNRGEGVIVANIDTGVSDCHYALWDRFTGNFAVATTTMGIALPTNIPFDDHNHGTATMSIMTGGCGLGMAPKARWTACKALNSQGTGYEADLIACFDYLLRLPSRARPQIINNSWGGGRGSTAYDETFIIARALRIFVVFTAGNTGPSCDTVSSPGDNRRVTTAGANARDGSLAWFSSRGYGMNGIIKPDIVAPGANVPFAIPNGYGSGSGTSFAAPLVAGAGALLISANPNLRVGETYEALISSANEPVYNGGCGQAAGVFPNNLWGAGTLDVARAFSK